MNNENKKREKLKKSKDNHTEEKKKGVTTDTNVQKDPFVENETIKNVFLNNKILCFWLIMSYFITWILGYYGYNFLIALWMIPLMVSYINGLIKEKILLDRKFQYRKNIWNCADKPQTEQSSFLNYLIHNCWITYSGLLEKTICESSYEPLNRNLPPLINKMKIEQMKMGNEPPVISNISIIESSNSIVVFTGDLLWTGGDSEMLFLTSTKLGTVPIKINQPLLNCRVLIKIMLLPNHPYIRKIAIGCINRPEMDMAIKPFGQIFVKGLSDAMCQQLKDLFTNTFVLPNKLVIEFVEEEQKYQFKEDSKDKVISFSNSKEDLNILNNNNSNNNSSSNIFQKRIPKISSPDQGRKTELIGIRGAGKNVVDAGIGVVGVGVGAGKGVVGAGVGAGKGVVGAGVGVGKGVVGAGVGAGKGVVGAGVGVGKGVGKNVVGAPIKLIGGVKSSVEGIKRSNSSNSINRLSPSSLRYHSDRHFTPKPHIKDDTNLIV